MSRIVSFAMSFLLSLTLFAQKNKEIPSFGQVEKTELEMKECSFDKDAGAMVLFNNGELNCIIHSGGVQVEFEYHVRIKILKDKGVKKADIHIPYISYRNEEQIRNLTAQTYNLDGTGNVVVSKLDKNQIYTKKLNKYYSEIAFALPEVKPGSVIEYKYSLRGAGLSPFYFQSDIPVMLSRYTTDFPQELEIYAESLCSLPLDVKTSNKALREIKTYTMRNVPALNDEPYISCDEDYKQQVRPRVIAVNINGMRTNLVRSWPRVIRDLMEDEDFGLQLKKEIPRTSDLDEALKKLSDPYQKMVTIHQYVRKNMQWDGKTSLWAFDGVKAAWKDKKGSDGEINLILVNLLKDAGLAAHPILVSTRENGRVNSAIPGIQQFNKVLAFVTIGDKEYVLDGTDKLTPSKLIPYNVMFSEGLVIEKLDTFEWGWRSLWNEQQQFKNVVVIEGKINEDGTMSGNATISSYDYDRLHRLPTFKNSKEQFIEKYLSGNIPGVKVEELSVENDEIDTLPFRQKFKFQHNISSSGDYKYFTANLFTGLEKNPFLADSRFSDVFFSANQQYSLVGLFRIPDDYAFEELPKSVRMIMPDTSIAITRRVAADKNQLSVRISLDFKKPYYSTEEYADLREFYKKMIDLLNEQFVIRKRAIP